MWLLKNFKLHIWIAFVAHIIFKMGRGGIYIERIFLKNYYHFVIYQYRMYILLGFNIFIQKFFIIFFKRLARTLFRVQKNKNYNEKSYV